MKLGAVVVSCLVALVLLEGVVRIYLALRGCTANCYASSVLMFQHHPRNGFELTPGFHLKSVVLDIAVNAHGLRGSELTQQPPAGTRRVAVLGGSSAFGYFVSEGDYASALLERRLREEGLSVEVLNGAVPSYNLAQDIVRFEERVRPLSPDVVILYLGWNEWRQISAREEPLLTRPLDWSYRWERLAAQSSLYSLLRFRLLSPPAVFVPPGALSFAMTPEGQARFERRLELLAEQIQKTPARMVVCSQAMLAHRDAAPEMLRKVAQTAEQQQQVIIFAEYLQTTLRAFADRHQAPFVDVYARVPPTDEFLGDPIHLTAAGERRVAELWHPAVVDRLAATIESAAPAAD